MTRAQVLDALDRAGGERKRAAELLGIGRATLYRWMKRHGMSSETGRLVAGRYEIVRDLGRGTHGRAFHVRDRMRGNVTRALKQLAPMAGPGDVERLREEFRTLSRLRHPGLVTVFDFGFDAATDAPYLVMELVEGHSFHEAAAGASLRTALARFARVLEAVGHMHRHGIVHRDLKPENVLVDTTGMVKVADLGLCEPLAGPELQAGGTLMYCAPEIFSGARASSRSDLYALGVMLYVTLAGRPPFEGASPAELMDAHRRGTYVPAGKAVSGLPEGLDAYIGRLLAVSPKERFGDCAEAREALERWIGGEEAMMGTAGSRPREVMELELVGREQLIAEVLEAVSGRGEARNAGLLLQGEAGVGKSRVLEALTRELVARGRRVARACCTATPGTELQPLAELLEDAIAVMSGIASESPAGQVLEEHREVLALLRRRRGDGQLVDRRGAFDRTVLLDAWRDLLAAAARHAPLVLVVDDLHEADALVVDALRLVSDGGATGDVRVLAAARPEGPSVARGRRAVLDDIAGWLEPLTLERLDPEAVASLAENTLGPARSSLLGPRLYEVTGGHPLYLQAVLGELTDSSASGPSESLADELPASLASALEGRLARAGRAGRDLLEWLAVRDRTARIDDLAALATCDANREVVKLARLGLVRATGPAEIDFSHALLRDACLARIADERRRAMHRRWANCLEWRETALVDRAVHLLASGARGDDAVATYRAAASELEETCRPAAAIPFLEAAVNSADPSDESALEMFARLEHAHRVVRDGANAIAVCERWVEAARRMDRPESEARARAMQASWLRERGDVDEAIRVAGEAIARAEASGDPGVLCAALKVRGTTSWVAWRREDAARDLERAEELARRTGDTARIGQALVDVALTRAYRGDPGGGLDLLERAERGFSDPAHLWWRLAVRNMRGLVLGYSGDVRSAIEVLASLVKEIRERGATMALTDPLENLALLQIRAGHYEDALATSRSLIEEGIRYGKPRYRLSGMLAYGEASHHLDDHHAAREHDRLALELAEALGEDSQLQYARLAAARDRRLQQQLSAAGELALAAYEAARRRRNPRQWGRAAAELARCARETGDETAARRWRTAALSALSVHWEDAHALRAECAAESARIHARHERWGLAAADLSEALGCVRRSGPLHMEIELLVELAAVEDARGDAANSRESLHSARRLMLGSAERIVHAERRTRYLEKPEFEPLRRIAARAEQGEGWGPTIEGSRADLNALYEISRNVSRGSDRQRLFDHIVTVALERVSGERAAIVLRDPESGALVVAASNGLEAETEKEVDRLSRSVLDRADRGQPVLVADTRVSPELARSASVAMFGIRSVMCVPLRAGDEILGTLYVDSRHPRRHFHEGSLRFLQAVADQSAIALAYTRLMEDLTREREAWRESLAEIESYEGLVGRSREMRRIYELIDRVAPTTLPVIVIGASGTGKELVARAIHRRSSRTEGPFLTENCAAIPEGLLESTLFGHERGAFTGADTSRPGLFERADRGTLLLDEIGDMSPALQARLLRVLQDGQVRRVGASDSVPVDVRVIAATHRDLAELIASGAFRQDLYFRLNGLTLSLPALAERREDLPLLVRHFLERESASLARPAPRLEPSVWRALMAHAWPGNVRELHSVLRRLVLLSDGPVIHMSALGGIDDGGLGGRSAAAARRPPPGPGGRSITRDQLNRALDEAGGNRVKAAALLGISRATLYRRLREVQEGPDG